MSPLVALGSSRLPYGCEALFAVPRCTFSRSGCRSSRLCLCHVAASRPVPPMRWEGAHASQHLFVGGGSLARPTQFLPLGLRLSSVFSPPSFRLHPSCRYDLRKCLAPSLLRLLPYSAVSCHCLPVGLPLLPLVSPFHVASTVCMCSQVHRSSTPRLRWPPTRSALGHRDVRLLHSVF